jgi:beta-glucosidase
LFQQKAWIAEAGNYKVAIGSSSLNIKKTALFSANIKIVEKKSTFTPDLKFTDLKH